jgi:UDP-N-acetylmuramate dehydrogenase
MQKNVSLKSYNTFGIDVKADWLAEIESVEQLLTILDDMPDMKKLILGSGSNVLFLNDFNGIVLLNKIKGKKIISENDEEIILEVQGGENWHDLVMWTVENNYGGIENLALIPGKAGTAPIQNIGAYGIEIKDVIRQVQAVDMKTLRQITFSRKDCRFGYRHSIFKEPENKDRYFIFSIQIKLRKKNHHLHTDYGAIQQILSEKKITSPTVKDIAEAVIEIRRSKLPDPKNLGNAGSFFKNPFIEKKILNKLLTKYPAIPYYPAGNNLFKIPAGWLIEQAGFKGKRFGNAGVHNKQALVLVNHGGATGQEIKDLADKIIKEVKKQFSITLQTEVNYI